MAEPMTWPPRDEQALASALAELANEMAFPPTPRIAEAVVAELRARPSRVGRALPWAGWRLGRSLAFALLALLVLAGAAVAFGILIGGLRITFAPGTSPPLPSGVVQSRAFGEEIGLDQARTRAGFPMLLPSNSDLGAPDHVFFLDFPSGGTVTLVWGPRPGYAADANGVGVVITEFKAIVDAEVWEKMVFGDTSVERTQVGGQSALWISGGEHTFFYRDASGRRVDSTLRVVGDTLVWERDGLVLRVEGAPSLPAAVKIGQSLK
jgi:hypothetical protein